MEAAYHTAVRHMMEADMPACIPARLLMIIAHVISAGLFGCEVWGTAYLKARSALTNPVEVKLRTILRRWMRQRKSCPSWCLYREFGLMPMQAEMYSRCC